MLLRILVRILNDVRRLKLISALKVVLTQMLILRGLPTQIKTLIQISVRKVAPLQTLVPKSKIVLHTGTSTNIHINIHAIHKLKNRIRMNINISVDISTSTPISSSMYIKFSDSI